MVRWEKKLGTWRPLVREQDNGDNLLDQRSSLKRSNREAIGSPIDEVYGKKTKSAGKYAAIKQETKALLLKYYPCPLSAIRDVNEFRNNNLLSDPKNREYIEAAFIDFGKDVNQMSIREIYEILKGHTDPIFYAGMDYATLEESLVMIEDLLKFQFEDSEEKITKFLVDLVDVLDKRIPKQNAFAVISPPSSGKNFFFDMITAICLNYGQLGQANKYNLFAFQEAPNKRLLLWNEPNYESAMTDTIKMMMGGDPYTVRVKYQGDTHVTRTPVLILTNNYVNFLQDSAFKDRIKVYKWRQAPFLKDIHVKPYPMAFFDLLNKYKIQF